MKGINSMVSVNGSMCSVVFSILLLCMFCSNSGSSEVIICIVVV